MAKTILLADDSVTIQKVVELTFMDEDYHVVATSDGEAALDRLPEVGPDLVIADVHMPGADGYEVCRRTKESHPGIPVLLLVGTFEQFDEQKAVEVGADGHLKKPFDSQDLLSQVEALVGGSKIAPVEDLGIPSETSTAEIPLAGAAAAAGQPAEEPSSVGDLEPPSLLDETAASAAAFEAGPAEPVDDVSDLAPEPLEAAPVDLEPPPFASEVLETAAVDLEAPLLDAPEFDDTATSDPAASDPAAGDSAASAPAPAPVEPEPVELEPVERESAEAESEIAAEPAAMATGDAVAEAPSTPTTAVGADAGEAAAATAASAAVATNGSGSLSDGDVERIAKRVAELVGDKALREVAWEVIPDLAEVIIKERIRELESQVE